MESLTVNCCSYEITDQQALGINVLVSLDYCFERENYVAFKYHRKASSKTMMTLSFLKCFS